MISKTTCKQQILAIIYTFYSMQPLIEGKFVRNYIIKDYILKKI